MIQSLQCIGGGLLVAAAALAALCSAYLAALTLAAFANRKRRQRRGEFTSERTKPHRFLILIPAHDEEQMIADTVRRIHRTRYPEEQFEVVVIADNCSDATVGECAPLDCRVLTRQDPENPGKGQALDWAVREHLRHWPRSYDAVLVVDADSCLNEDFLWFMNSAMSAGHSVLQGYYTVRNPADNWRTSLLAASLALFHFLRPLGRDTLGLPCGLKGNGFLLRRDVVESYGYPAGSNVEDVELSLFLITRGIGARFVPGAQVFGQMTTSAEAAAQQRTRWEGGRIHLLRQWTRPLLLAAWKRRSPACLDALVDLLVPPFALLAAGTVLVLALAAGWTLAGEAAAPRLAASLSGGSLLLQVAYTLGGLLLVRAPGIVWRRLLTAPAYVLWKLILYLKLVKTPEKTSAWDRTERNAPDPSTNTRT